MQENVDLRPHTSLYVGGKARFFREVFSVNDLKDALIFAQKLNLPVFVLGGGSNVIVSDSGFSGLVIKVLIDGIKVVSEDGETKVMKVGSGVNWDDFVKYATQNVLYGVENLSHIPGTVGASVVQNIGAYGQEVASTVLSVNVLDRETLAEKVLLKKDLVFSYRKSVLNDETKEKNKYVVTSVQFELKKNSELNMNYTDIKKYFENHPELKPSLETLRSAIISLRDSKFPFPDSPVHGTVGSFWNADTIDEKTYNNIILKLEEKGFHKKADEMRNKKSVFTVAQGYKVPYGVLVEVLGFKGKVFNKAKILDTHSCVINNFTGEATAKNILDISNSVIERVKEEFGITMKIEPELVGEHN